jgi:hypothetical protein
MTARRPQLEKEIQSQIEIAIGSEPDLLLLRNSCGHAKFVNEEDGKTWHVPYGLGNGSPDLVGLLRRQFRHRSNDARQVSSPLVVGVWFCLEVKVPGEYATPEQEKVHKLWRRFGAFVAVVHGVAEARAALARARDWAETGDQH